MRIEIDHDGYPTEASLEALRAWTCKDGDIKAVVDVLEAVADYLTECGYGRANRSMSGNVWRFATGGWSGCEEVIGAIPPIVHALAWRSSHRGGLHVYGLSA